MPPTKIEKYQKTELKSDGKFIYGYAAKWDNPDKVKDTFAKSVFKRSETDLKDGKILLRSVHKYKDDSVYKNVGVIKEYEEDEIGFKIKAELFDTSDAKFLHEVVSKAPHALGLSTAGYVYRENKNKYGGNEFVDVKLDEITIAQDVCDESTKNLIAADSEFKFRMSKLNRMKIRRQLTLKELENV